MLTQAASLLIYTVRFLSRALVEKIVAVLPRMKCPYRMAFAHFYALWFFTLTIFIGLVSLLLNPVR